MYELKHKTEAFVLGLGSNETAAASQPEASSSRFSIFIPLASSFHNVIQT